MNSSSEYNDEPVFYCKECMSLRIQSVASGLDLDYCDECGSTDIEQSHINDWEQSYKDKYGFNYLTREIYGREERN